MPFYIDTTHPNCSWKENIGLEVADIEYLKKNTEEGYYDFNFTHVRLRIKHCFIHRATLRYEDYPSEECRARFLEASKSITKNKS